MRERIETTAEPRPLKRFGIKERPLLVLGTGPGWKEDLDRLKLWKFDKMMINKSVYQYRGHIDHYTTHHYENVEAFLFRRFAWLDALPPPLNCCVNFQVHAPFSVDTKRDFSYLPGYDWKITGSEGSSGLYGVCIGFRLGYTTVVCAGMPMTGSHEKFYWQNNWIKFHRKTGERLSSMSGWTRELCGPPAREYLCDYNSLRRL